MIILKDIFQTVQGEGHFVGVPSLFIRLAGCNFTCGYCDTDWKRGFAVTVSDLIFLLEKIVSYDFTEAMSSNLIMQEVEAAVLKGIKLSRTSSSLIRVKDSQLPSSFIRQNEAASCSQPSHAHAHAHFVVTGGEPTVQKDIVWLTRELRSKFPECRIQFESNGSVSPDKFSEFRYKNRIWFTLSPKTLHPDFPLHFRNSLEYFQYFKGELKIVCENADDFLSKVVPLVEENRMLMTYYSECKGLQFWIMLEDSLGDADLAQETIAKVYGNKLIRKFFRISPRLQKQLRLK